MEGSVAASPEGGAEEGASLVWRRFFARTSVSGGVGAGAFLVNPSPPSAAGPTSRRVRRRVTDEPGDSLLATRAAATYPPPATPAAVAAARVDDVSSCCCFSSCLFQRISFFVSIRFKPCSGVGWSHTISSSSSSRDCFWRTQNTASWVAVFVDATTKVIDLLDHGVVHGVLVRTAVVDAASLCGSS